jgi:hypothetical protein
MAKYIASGLSVKRCAAMLAKENKSLARDARYGPSGTTSAETMEKQIRREKGRMTKDALYRERVERLIEEYRKDPHHHDEMFKRAHQKKTFRE